MKVILGSTSSGKTNEVIKMIKSVVYDNNQEVVVFTREYNVMEIVKKIKWLYPSINNFNFNNVIVNVLSNKDFNSDLSLIVSTILTTSAKTVFLDGIFLNPQQLELINAASKNRNDVSVVVTLQTNRFSNNRKCLMPNYK